MSLTVIVSYVPDTVQSTAPLFSYFSVFQPADEAWELVTMETTTQENLSSDLSPLPHPLIYKILIYKIKTHRINHEIEV